MVRKILHLDLDAFFCAVEELRRPEIAGKPFAVGGKPGERGVVASCSYAARAFGVRSAMPMVRALRLCPALLVLSGDHARYSEVSHQVMAYLHSLTPVVEQVSIDEAFMDFSDVPTPAANLARQIQQGVRERFGLPCSLGAAANKLLAKMATDYGKSQHRGSSPPCAVTVVPPGHEAAFLAPLPVIALWGVGQKTADRLAQMGVRTIGELAALPEATLTAEFGKNGHDLSQHARGIDLSPLEMVHEVKSISQEVTFERDVADAAELYRTLTDLSISVGYRLRSQGMGAVTVRVKLRWPSFSTQSRQITLQTATDQDSIISTAAQQLFESVWQRGQAVRLLGVGVSGLQPLVYQPGLWDTRSEKERRLLAALDDLRERFGSQVIQRGRLPGKKNR